MEKILLVEDESNIQELISEILKEEGYDITCASNGQEGYDLFKDNKYDLIISDVMMPILDGHQFVKLVRNKDKDIPIILLTALNEEYDEIKGFDLGVDDYISKPFSYKILVKRVASMLKRTQSGDESKILKHDNIVLNPDQYTCVVEGETIPLTLKEFEILKLLMTNIDSVISRNQLLDEVWGYSYYGDSRVIDTHIKNIRRKTKTEKIKTVTGVGYKLEK